LGLAKIELKEVLTMSVVWLKRYRRRLRIEPPFDANDPDFPYTPKNGCFYCGEPFKDSDLAVFWSGLHETKEPEGQVIWLHPECTLKLVARLYADAITAIVYAREQTLIKEVERILSTEPFSQVWSTLKPQLEAIHNKTKSDTPQKQGNP
jgi:hypothetical protein